MNKVFLSTGAFTGRINGDNYRLLADYCQHLNCDGFELMIFSVFYSEIENIIELYNNKKINIEVIHSDKKIGDLLSSPKDISFDATKSLFIKNLEISKLLGARKIVVHGWGIPDSDKYSNVIYNRIGELKKISDSYEIDMLIENCICINKSPLLHLENLQTIYPDLGFIIDTRCSEFHLELEETLNSNIWNKNVRHIHINDYLGGYKDWEARYPIPQPLEGKVNWGMFFKYLKSMNYSGTITLEAPSIISEGVDTITLNRGLKFIYDNIK